MNKTQLIDALSARFDGNRKAAAHALESVVDTITREVAKGEKVAITGFGSFEKRLRPARTVRNPQTGGQIKTRKTFVPRFSAGSELKAVVSGVKKLPRLSLPSLPGKKTAAAPVEVATTKAAAPAKKAAATAKTPAAKKASAPAKKAATKAAAPAKKAAATAKTTATKTTATKAAAPAKKAAPVKAAPVKAAPAETPTAAAKKAPAKKASST